MYAKRNIETRCRNHCCRGKAVTYFKCVSVACYPACSAHAPCYVVISGLSGSTTFSILPHKRHGFRGNVAEHKKRVSIFSTNLV